MILPQRIFINVAIRWKSRKVKSLFSTKEKKLHLVIFSCKIYRGECTCGTEYIGETERNVRERWSEHDNIKNKSEPAKHLYENAGHNFTWSILLSASKNARTRKNLEAFYIAKLKPSLNEQVESNVLNLFRNGVT